MDKNAKKDVGKLLSKIEADMALVILAVIAAFIANELTEFSPIVVGLSSFVLFVIIYYLLMELKWAIRRKKGFVIVKSNARLLANEDEKPIWIEVKSSDEFNKLKINVILRRLQYGVGIQGMELTVGKDRKPFIKNKEIENIPEKIFLAKGCEDKLKILIEDESFDMIATESYDEFHIQEKFEIVVEINGKINEEYFFSEMYKGSFTYTCTKEPNIFIGSEENAYRTTQIKWENFIRWSEKEEDKRNKLRKEYQEQEKLQILGT